MVTSQSTLVAATRPIHQTLMAIANGCFIGTLFAYGGIYWVGEAMGNINYVALSTTPRKVGEAIEVAAANAAHFAALLKAETIGE